jgi:REP element-mobilizing transposase RayT
MVDPNWTMVDPNTDRYHDPNTDRCHHPNTDHYHERPRTMGDPKQAICIQVMPNHVHRIIGSRTIATTRTIPTSPADHQSPLWSKIRWATSCKRSRPPPVLELGSRQAVRDGLMPRRGVTPSNGEAMLRRARSDRGAEVWQRGYIERIIRDDGEHEGIAGYIADNPKNWKGDRFNR